MAKTRQVELRRLPDGLRVVMVPCEAESVAVGIFVASGSRHETAKTAGISHFIEHMLFKGTATRKPIDISRAIEGRGGRFNAMTGEESTCYYAQLPDEFLADAVDILSDMYLHASFPADEFEREKQVVIEEIKMYADEPDSVAAENLQRNVFPGSPLGLPVAGSADSLLPMKPDGLRRYVKAHYRADNTVVVVTGAFDADQAFDIVSRSFRGISRAKPRSIRAVAPEKNPVVPSQVVSKDVQQAQLALGYRSFGVADPRKYAASVMDAVLGRGMSSRLFQEVREKRGLSYDISSRMNFFADAGIFTVSAGMDAKNGEKALATIDREIGRICAKRVSAAELARVKEFVIGNFRLSHEGVVSRMFFYGQTMLAFDRIVTPAEQVEGVRAVTATELQSVAQDIFSPENRSVSWVVPK